MLDSAVCETTRPWSDARFLTLCELDGSTLDHLLLMESGLSRKSTDRPTLYKSPSGRKFTKSPSGRRVTFVFDDPSPVTTSAEASPTVAFAEQQQASTFRLPPHSPLKPALVHRPEESPPEPMSLYAKFKAAAKALKQEVVALYYAIHDPRTPLLAKILPWMVLMYALSPLDLIPDFIPVLGLLDDLLLLPGLIWLSIRMIPKVVMAQARFRAETEPLRLSRTWFLAVLIFLLWMAGLEYLVYWAVASWGSPVVQDYVWHILGGVAAVGTLTFIWWLTSQIQKERRKRDKAELERQQQSMAGDEETGEEFDRQEESQEVAPACLTDLNQPLLPCREESMVNGD